MRTPDDPGTRAGGPYDAGRHTARTGPDAGAGAVWLVAVIMVVWLVACAVTLAGGVRAARHRAHLAADQAALAAALARREGAARPCAEAARLARRNGALLAACALTGEVADVTVSRTVRTPFGRTSVTARARAGPAYPALAGPVRSRPAAPSGHDARTGTAVGVTSAAPSRCTRCTTASP